MYKGGRIIASLVVFVAFLGFPFFYNMGKANAEPKNLAENIKLIESTQHDIEPASWMIANHMKLLDQWRQAYVRDGQTIYVNNRGEKFPININTWSNTVGANSNQFCITCHNYVGVQLNCFSCHTQGGTL
ncbi:sulfate reduction electron transfer complex DsrMKJOP subunit DsrJ [Desulfosporosinus sp. FKA]|uniref:sulfate reduction electron transfer complex DsrMKJOP subunit DsrJ n=1 Tax=Desulfosporosinus sp. FKA TaxID=1969834 RepID=UPI000B49BEA9|nr:sulfate reduction electron transfer complex DsrMKJOP subunit DsrJ [Desulfosporosinus sp. FKA]